MKDREETAKRKNIDGRRSLGLTPEERAATKERANELGTPARRGPRAATADDESDVLAKIAEMPKSDRTGRPPSP